MSKPKQKKEKIILDIGHEKKNISYTILKNKIVVKLSIHENGHHILWTSYFYVFKI